MTDDAGPVVRDPQNAELVGRQPVVQEDGCGVEALLDVAQGVGGKRFTVGHFQTLKKNPRAAALDFGEGRVNVAALDGKANQGVVYVTFFRQESGSQGDELDLEAHGLDASDGLTIKLLRAGRGLRFSRRRDPAHTWPSIQLRHRP